MIFDLELHVIHRYTGEARLQRLLWVALHSAKSPDLQQAAFEACLIATKHQKNVFRYKEIYHHHPLGLPPYDAAWVQEAESHNRHDRELLLVRLQSAQAHLNKEAVRAAFTGLSTFYWQTGDLPEAFHAAVRAKDYCTSRPQTASNSLLILAVALHMRNYAAVQDYVPRLEHTVGILSNTTATATAVLAPADTAFSAAAVKNKVLTASALDRLAAGDYEAAAKKFQTVALSMPQDVTNTTLDRSSCALDDWDTIVLAPDDVALYAVVLTLAAAVDDGDRRASLQLAEHPEALERMPILRDILTAFYKRAAYGTSWQLLEDTVWPILQHDIYFQQQNLTAGQTHMQVLQEAIRYKAMGFYWKAYHNCPLNIMAEQLGTGIAGSAEELHITVLKLLKNRRHSKNTLMIFPMDTRMDCRGVPTLVRSLPDPAHDRWQATAQKLQTTSTRVLDETYSLVIRLACRDNDSFADPLPQRPSAARSSGGSDWGATPPTRGFAQAEVQSSDEETDFVDTHQMLGVDAVVDDMNPEDLY